jgi:hypothetical protein
MVDMALKSCFKHQWEEHLQLMKATVLAESSILSFTFSLGSLCYSDVYTDMSQVGVTLFPSF